MEEKHSCEVNRSSDSQEILRTLWSPEVYYRIHRSPSSFPIQSTPRLFHFLKTEFNITLLSTSRSCKWSLSHRLFPPNPLSPISHICHMPHPSHSSWFDHPNNLWCRVQITKLLNVQYSPVPCYLVPFSPKHLPQHPILKHPQYMLLPQCEGPGLNWKKKLSLFRGIFITSFGTSKGLFLYSTISPATCTHVLRSPDWKIFLWSKKTFCISPGGKTR